jgi:hypothetical protein
MGETALWLLAAFALIFVINLVPAFMPSSWMVMAFFYLQFDVPLLPLTIIGAVVSGFGRFFLARGSTWLKRTFMRGKARDLDELGEFLEERERWLAPTVAAYSLTPLPTNNLFVAAGLAEVSLFWVLIGFWTARMAADTLFVWTTDQAFDSVGDVFEGVYGDWLGIAVQLLSVTSIVLLYLLPWARWLRRLTAPRNSPEPGG